MSKDIMEEIEEGEISLEENETAEEIPHEEPTKKGKKKKAKKKKKHRFLKALLIIILVLVAAAAAIVFGFYKGVYPVKLVEFGSKTPEASSFLWKGGKASYAEDFDISTADEGFYVAGLKTNGRVYKVFMLVRDTKAPTAKDAKVRITIEDELEPIEALKKVKEAGEVSAEWVKAPDFGEAGTYNCKVKLSDNHGNSKDIKTTVVILGAAEVVEYEAGTEKPLLKDFMVIDTDKASFKTDLDKITWDVLGDYDVDVKVNGKTYTSILRIVDTTAPVPDIVPYAVTKGGEVNVDNFTLTCEDATAVSYEFKEAPDSSEIGTSKCSIVCTDAAGNAVETETELYVCDKVIELEAGNDAYDINEIMSLAGEEFNNLALVGEEYGFTPKELGGHVFTFTDGIEEKTLGVNVVDTVAPTGDALTTDCCTGYPCKADKFVENIVDVTPVKVSYVAEPDWTKDGEQAVKIALTDRAGNVTELDCTAVLAKDSVAPQICTSDRRECYVGEAVAYFKDITAIDNADPEPKLTVDNSKVDPRTPGEYEVVYTATDAEGNVSTQTVIFSFIEKAVSDEEVMAKVKEVLAEIWTDGMTTEEKAYAVFNYCYDRIGYIGYSDKTDYRAEAYRGMTEHVGDCYTYQSTARLLLEQIDDDTLQMFPVERVGDPIHHYWLLVNMGTGWYDFDPCNVSPNKIRVFMKAHYEITPLSERYWRLDLTKVPELATTPYVPQSKNIVMDS